MATQVFNIIKSYGTADGLIITKSKERIGEVWNRVGPEDKFISAKLNGHWIITDEEYKLLNKLKKDEKLSDLAKD